MVPKDGPIIVYALDKQTTSMLIVKQQDLMHVCEIQYDSLI